MGSDAAGVGHATSSSPTDQLTRQHRMTLDEAQLILNVKRGDEMQQISKVIIFSLLSFQLKRLLFRQNYEHLFKANAPLPKPSNPTGKQLTSPSHSHYLQSKVFRARERIEAELKVGDPPTEIPGNSGPMNPTNHSGKPV
jgi:import inner membrane translocase subunit TIM16